MQTLTGPHTTGGSLASRRAYTGARSCRDAPCSRGRGFTVIELLVVIVILGVVAGMVSLSVAPSEQRRLTEELDRLAALFRLAHDEARISGRAITWEAGADGYRFLVSDDERGGNESDDPLRASLSWTSMHSVSLRWCNERARFHPGRSACRACNRRDGIDGESEGGG